MEPERLWRKGFVKEINFKSEVKGQGCDGESRWLMTAIWYDVCRMRWTRRRVNTRMRLTEWRKELFPQIRWSERAVGDLIWGRYRSSSYGDTRGGASYTCTLNRDKIVQVVRLAGSENFVGEWEEFIFNALINLEPVQRSEDGCDKKF